MPRRNHRRFPTGYKTIGFVPKRCEHSVRAGHNVTYRNPRKIDGLQPCESEGPNVPRGINDDSVEEIDRLTSIFPIWTCAGSSPGRAGSRATAVTAPPPSHAPLGAGTSPRVRRQSSRRRPARTSLLGIPYRIGTPVEPHSRQLGGTALLLPPVEPSIRFLGVLAIPASVQPPKEEAKRVHPDR